METDPCCFNCKSELPSPYQVDQAMAARVSIIFAVIGAVAGPIIGEFCSPSQGRGLSMAGKAISVGIGAALLGIFGYCIGGLFFKKKLE